MNRTHAARLAILMMAILAMVSIGFASSGASPEETAAPSVVVTTTASTSTTTATPDRLEARVEEVKLASFYAEIERQDNERRFYAEIERQKERQRVEIERRRAEQASRATTTTTTTAAATATPAPPASPQAGPSTGRCGGDLPPCYVMTRESRGDIRIWNGGCHAPTGWSGGSSPCGGSTASGKWQFIRGTWAGYGGYLNAADAPESVQDAKARQLWAGGRGCGHWSACG